MGKFKAGTKIRLISNAVDGFRDIGDIFTAADDYQGTRAAQGADGAFLQAYVDRKGKITHCPSEYFEAVAPALKLEVGKFYKADNGTKVGPMEVWDGHKEDATGSPVYVSDSHTSHYWCEDGKNGEPRTKPNPKLNLISDWSDEVTFKVGDKVRRVSNGAAWAPIGYETVLTGKDGNLTYTDKNGGVSVNFYHDMWELVHTAAITSPITTETITRNRVVPGVYGRLELKGTEGNELMMRLASRGGVEGSSAVHVLNLDELEELHTNIGLIINAMRNPEVVE